MQHMKATWLGALVIAFGAASVSGCDRKATASEAKADSSARATAGVAPWEPFDENFRGCEGG